MLNNKIFISVVSYEDPTLIRTLVDAYENADNPENLVFGLALQYLEEPEIDFIPRSQLKILSFHPQTRPGVSRMRYLLTQMVDDESFFLQIDSHTEFVKSWDSVLIQQLDTLKAVANSEKVLLTHAHLKTLGDGAIEYIPSFRVYLDNVGRFDLFLDGGDNLADPDKDIHEDFYESRDIHANFIFSETSFIREVEYEKITQALYEEPYLTYKAFMLGWRAFSPKYYFATNHNDEEYREHMIKIGAVGDSGEKIYTIIKDSEVTRLMMQIAFTHNIGPFKVEGTDKDPLEFWKEFGIDDKFNYCYAMNQSIIKQLRMLQ